VVFVWRNEISVLHRTLEPDEAEVANRVASGVKFATLCEVLADLHGEEASVRAAQMLLHWLENATLIALPPEQTT
jgi:hypothetical protein